MSGVVFAALFAGIFVLGMTWGYVLVLTFSGHLIKPPPPADPTEFVRCGDIAMNLDGEPLVCVRLRGHDLPHKADDGCQWEPIPESWFQ